MSSEFTEFMAHTITVETKTGTGSLGDVFATPQTYSPETNGGVLVDEKRRLVRGTDAAEVISEATIYDQDTTRAAAYATGSRVTLPAGRVATVITTRVLTSGDLDLPDHLEVAVT